MTTLEAARDLVVDPLLSLVFPAQCPACQAALRHPSRGPVCEGCWAALPRHRGLACGCGQPLESPGAACARCRRGLAPFRFGASLGPFEGALRVAVHELKYKGRRSLARRLAQELFARPDAAELLASAALLVPVPLHARRRTERGFNQAELIARELGSLCGLPVDGRALCRRVDTPSQTGLSAAARRSNVASAFTVAHPGAVCGRVVVLVDDVITTGATVRACARALLAAGAREVRVLAAARAL